MIVDKCVFYCCLAFDFRNHNVHNIKLFISEALSEGEAIKRLSDEKNIDYTSAKILREV